ncbi:MAG: hypothetical protein WBB73_16020 [Candidatus Aminicenantaceae bacterium]
MSVKTKITTIIVITLFIGVAIGAMLNRALLHRRISRTLAWGNPAAMTVNLERMLSPTDEQSKQIRKILDEYGAVLLKIREESMRETMETMQALEAALAPILTPAQTRYLSRRNFGPRAFGKPGQGMQPGRRPERRSSEELEGLAVRLTLSPDQISQIRRIFQQRGIASPLGGGSRDIEGTLLRWANRQKQLDQAIAGILTEEQKQEYARIKQERRQQILDLLDR